MTDLSPIEPDELRAAYHELIAETVGEDIADELMHERTDAEIARGIRQHVGMDVVEQYVLDARERGRRSGGQLRSDSR